MSFWNICQTVQSWSMYFAPAAPRSHLWHREVMDLFNNNRRVFQSRLAPPSVIDLSRLRKAPRHYHHHRKKTSGQTKTSTVTEAETSEPSEAEVRSNCCGTARNLYSLSTVPGFSQIAQSKHPIRILLWFVAFVGLGSVAIRNLYDLLDEYFQYPLTVSIRLEDMTNVEFPAVTFCNLNPVRKNLLCGRETDLSYELQEYLCNKSAVATVVSGSAGIKYTRRLSSQTR